MQFNLKTLWIIVYITSANFQHEVFQRERVLANIKYTFNTHTHNLLEFVSKALSSRLQYRRTCFSRNGVDNPYLVIKYGCLQLPFAPFPCLIFRVSNENWCVSYAFTQCRLQNYHQGLMKFSLVFHKPLYDT